MGGGRWEEGGGKEGGGKEGGGEEGGGRRRGEGGGGKETIIFDGVCVCLVISYINGLLFWGREGGYLLVTPA